MSDKVYNEPDIHKRLTSLELTEAEKAIWNSIFGASFARQYHKDIDRTTDADFAWDHTEMYLEEAATIADRAIEVARTVQLIHMSNGDV